MMNMQNMMRQAQKLQKQMEQSQAELAAMQFVGKSAQDLVQATLTGDKKVISIDFNPAVIDPEDLETLSDMTVQAINSALEQIDETTKKNWVLSLGNCHSKNKELEQYLSITKAKKGAKIIKNA